MDDNGFLVKLREENYFDIESYNRIKYLLKKLVDKYNKNKNLPKKFVLIIIELIQHLVAGNKFMDEEQQIKIEDAGLEIIDILNEFYKYL